MERKKPDKLNFALPINNSDYYEEATGEAGGTHPQNINESVFFKYASSIFQVVSEDRLDSSRSVGGGNDPGNTIF
jgi:hypothetical protein